MAWLLVALAAYLALGLIQALVEVLVVEDNFDLEGIVETVLVWPVILALKVRDRLSGRSPDSLRCSSNARL